MAFLDHVNLITVLLVSLFILPIIAGLFNPLDSARVLNAFSGSIGLLFLIISIVFSVSLVNLLFSDNGVNYLSALFKTTPALYNSIVSKDVFVYILTFIIFMLVINYCVQLLFIPLNNKVLRPLADRITSFMGSLNRGLKRAGGGLWQIPKSFLLVLFISFLFSFYASFSNNSALDNYIKSSGVYRVIEKNAVEPIVSSEAAKKIPALIDGTINKAMECLSPEGRKLLFKVYINGVTVDEAVKSSPGIDNKAIDIAGAENDDYKTAKLLYDWIALNISYDHNKAKTIESNPFGAPSGAVAAFDQRTGVCFDKACLYVSMCRAVGVRVRLVTGLGYNGADWTDHSWNQIYCDKENRWVNVDTTFGKINENYFDRSNFDSDHMDAEIQGEW